MNRVQLLALRIFSLTLMIYVSFGVLFYYVDYEGEGGGRGVLNDLLFVITSTGIAVGVVTLLLGSVWTISLVLFSPCILVFHLIFTVVGTLWSILSSLNEITKKISNSSLIKHPADVTILSITERIIPADDDDDDDMPFGHQ